MTTLCLELEKRPPGSVFSTIVLKPGLDLYMVAALGANSHAMKMRVASEGEVLKDRGNLQCVNVEVWNPKTNAWDSAAIRLLQVNIKPDGADRGNCWGDSFLFTTSERAYDYLDRCVKEDIGAGDAFVPIGNGERHRRDPTPFTFPKKSATG